ncbi:MAG: lactate 2-monooxygenase, partial [Bacteroidetes bacterium]
MATIPDQGALLRQRDIFLGGAAGQRPRLPVSLEALEGAAEKVLSPAAFAYLAGGAGREDTVRH